MENWNLEKNARIGIKEAVAWYTIIVDVSLAAKSHNWGTGSLLDINGRKFILTCKHVVREEYQNEDLRFIYRSEQGLKEADKDTIKKSPLYLLVQSVDKTYPQEIPVANRFYSDDVDDLVLIELESSSREIKDYRFFKVSLERIISPEIEMVTYILGFSIELTRRVGKYGFGSFYYFLGSKIINANTDYSDFNPNRHFLIGFAIDDDSVDPHGLSGCGVWTRLPSGKDNLWTPNLYLVGVQTAFYPSGKKIQPIKATKADRLYDLISE